MKRIMSLSNFLTEYVERNDKNQYVPVAVGRYGIRKREDIYSKELAKDYSKNKLIFKDTLTVGMGSVQMDIGVLVEQAIYSVSPAYHTYIINGINSSYLKYCLECRNMDMFSRYVKRGSRQGKSIDLKRWLTYEIPVYSEGEQQEIVGRIDFLDGLIANVEQEIELMDNLVKSRFVEMFGDERNSKCYPVIKIQDVADVQVGVVIKPSQYYTDSEHGVKAFRSLNIGEMHIKDDDWVYFSEEGQKKNAKSVLHKNDLVIVRSGAPGTACVITDAFDGSNAVDVIIAHPDMEKVNPYYLCAYTNYPHGKHQIEEGTGGAAQQHFNVGKYKEMDLIYPPKAEQDAFVAFVAQTDKSKYCVKNDLLRCLQKQVLSKSYRR